MNNRNILKPTRQPIYQLSSKSDLRDKQQSLPSRSQHPLHSPDVHLGLAAAANSKQIRNAETSRVDDLFDSPTGRLLMIGEHEVRLNPGEIKIRWRQGR